MSLGVAKVAFELAQGYFEHRRACARADTQIEIDVVEAAEAESSVVKTQLQLSFQPWFTQ